MNVEIRNNRNLYAGLLFVVVGAAAMFMAHGYKFGSTTQMGPGYFPMVLGGILVLLGLLVGVRGLRMPEKITAVWSPRALVTLTLSVILFAWLIRFAGFVPALAALIFGSAAGGSEFKLGEVAILTVVVTTLTTALIVFGLGLPYPLFGTN